MSAIRLSLPHPHVVQTTQRGPAAGSGVTGTARRAGRFGVRDNRDDGPVIGGLLVGLTLATLIWALIIGLLVVLL